MIPVYKVDLNPWEIISIKRAFSVFGHRVISLLVPDSLREAVLSALARLNLDPSACVLHSVPGQRLTSVATYNALLLDAAFYRHYLAFDYLLIYQLDAYVFDDRLDQWMATECHYLGGLVYPPGAPYGSSLPLFAGSGGFSLRHVAAFVRVLDPLRICYGGPQLRHTLRPFNCSGRIVLLSHFLCFLLEDWILRVMSPRNPRRLARLSHWMGINEDHYFGKLVPQVHHWFCVLPLKRAPRFCIDAYPAQTLPELESLPFGAHAWWRSPENLSAWWPHIEELQRL